MVKLTHTVTIQAPTGSSTTTSTSYEINARSCAFYYDSSKYTNPTFRLEVRGYVSSGGTVSFILLSTDDDSTGSSTTEVSGSVVTTTATSASFLTSSDFTLTNGKRYWLGFKTTSGSYTAYSVGAKLTIIDDVGETAPSVVETYVNVGAVVTSSTSYTTPSNSYPSLFYYDSSKYDGTINIYLEARAYTNSGTGHIRLWNYTDGTEVSGSEISITDNAAVRIRSTSFSLTTGKIYYVQAKHDAGIFLNNVHNARLVIQQSGTITKTRSVIAFSAYNTYTSSTYGIPDYIARYPFKTSEINSPVISVMWGIGHTGSVTTYMEVYDNTASRQIQELSKAVTAGTMYVERTALSSSLLNGHDFVARLKTPSGTFYSYGIALLLDTSFDPTYHAEIPVNYSSDGEQTNYQMKLTINSGTGSNSAGTIYLNSHALNWPYDIQFRNSSGGKLSHWRESYDANTQTVWVKCDSIASSGTTSFDIYYGDADMGDSSDGDATFNFFDDFPGTTFDTSKWTAGSQATVSGGIATFTGGLTVQTFSVATFGTNTAVRSRATLTYGSSRSIIGYYDNGNEIAEFDGNTPTANVYNARAKHYSSVRGTNLGTSYSGAYHIWDVIRYSTSSIVYKIDDSQVASETSSTYIPTSSLYVHLHQATSGSLLVDWTCVRKVTVNEPTWATPGSETLTSSTTTYTFTKNSDAFVILQENLKARYDMSTTLSTQLKDLSGYANHGTAYGGVTIGGAAGINGNCTDFETDDYIDIGSGTSITSFSGNKLTLVAWVYPDSLTTYFPIFYCTQYKLSVNTSGQVEVSLSLGGTVYTKTFGSAGAVATESWTQIAFTFDGTNWDVYINKAHQTTQTQTGTLDTTSNSVILGRKI